MCADQYIIPSGVSVMEIDVTNAAHVCSKVVDLVYLTCGQEAII